MGGQEKSGCYAYILHVCNTQQANLLAMVGVGVVMAVAVYYGNSISSCTTVHRNMCISFYSGLMSN